MKDDQGYWAVRAVPGIGAVLGAVFVAEVGDAKRFSTPAQLCSWAGLTPRHHEPGTTVRRGRITKQGAGSCVGRRRRQHSGRKAPLSYKLTAGASLGGGVKGSPQ